MISVSMFSFSGAPVIQKVNFLYQSSTFLIFFLLFQISGLQVLKYFLVWREFPSFIIPCFCLLVCFPQSPFLLVFVTGGHGEQGQVFVSVPRVSETLSQHQALKRNNQPHPQAKGLQRSDRLCCWSWSQRTHLRSLSTKDFQLSHSVGHQVKSVGTNSVYVPSLLLFSVQERVYLLAHRH